MPLVIKRLKAFTKGMKEKRKVESEEFLKVQAKQEIEELKSQMSPMMTIDRSTKRRSIFTVLTHNSKIKDITALKVID